MESVEKMNIVIVGHVDHGKSTVIGRLLADTGALPAGKLEQIERYCERHAQPFEYAFLIDALKDERRQNITIDSARVFFNSERRRYIVLDAPGHIEFLKNMVTGAARAEAALLVIDALEGIQENSRRHGYMLSLLGIRQLAVLVNKLDLVNYSPERFESIRSEYAQFLASVGLNAKHFIPISARFGDNISRSNDRMAWYGGETDGAPTVLQALDGFEKEKPPRDRPFRLPVQDVYRFSEDGDDRRIVAGTVASGAAAAGDELVFYPSGKRSRVERIQSWPENASCEQQIIVSGQAAGLTLVEQVYVQRGEIAARADEPPPQTARRVRASIFWLGKAPLAMRTTYTFKLGTTRRRGHLEEILRVLDSSTLEDRSQAALVERNEAAECILAFDQPLACDETKMLPETSRFVIVDDYDIRGGGMILEVLPDAEVRLRQQAQVRMAHWIPSDVTAAQRAALYHQAACLVIITGKQGAGRKRLARALEKHLFDAGKFVYYLGMGSVVYGVDADIAGHPEPKIRREHVRRMAEIANILLDAGLILIITAVELTQSDLDLFHTSIHLTEVMVIWVGDDRDSDIARDLVIEAGDASSEELQRIQSLLQGRYTR